MRDARPVVDETLAPPVARPRLTPPPCADGGLRRTLDPAFLTAVANHPEVHPWVAPTADAVDLAPVITHPANVTLVTDHGGFIGIRQEPGLYDVHSLFLPSGRGRVAVAAMTAALQYMFIQTDCVELRTQLPEGNRAARGLARLAGFRTIFSRPGAWVTPAGAVAVEFAGLSLPSWIARSPEARAAGTWFHDTLETATRALGASRPTHPDDPAHDHAAGAAVLMLQAGNPVKAVETYNRWARFAGYATISMLSQHPPVIDLHDVVITVTHGQMEIVPCPSEQC